jgi:(p)ppGpp synthase/HD superfamily hydrolase
LTDLPPLPLTDRYERALAHALRLHRDQGRKGTTIPYLSHLLSVSALVLEDGGDEDMAIAGLLHDAGEDAGGRGAVAEIRALFGERVAGIVEACTDTFESPKPAWWPRKRAYIAHLRSPELPDDARRVSLCDKVHNARAILADYRVVGEPLWERFTSRRDGTLWYYGALLEAFRATLGDTPRGLVSELGRTVDELNRLAARPGGGELM